MKWNCRVPNTTMNLGSNQISSDSVDSEWEFSNNAIYEINRILLCMPLINFQGTDSRCIINDGILKAPYFLTFLNSKIKKFHINLPDLFAP